MDRGTIASLAIACVSLMTSVVVNQNAKPTYYHALALLLPLVCIAFPEIAEAACRVGFRGRVHVGTGPTPGLLIRIAAWACLLAVVFAHHSRVLFGVAA